MTRYQLKDVPEGPMRPKDVKRELKRLRVSQVRCADWLGITESTICRWLRGAGADRMVSRMYAEAVLTAARCIDQGIDEPDTSILGAMEWTPGANIGRPRKPRPRPKPTPKSTPKPKREPAQDAPVSELDGLRKQIARMEAALQFYADYTTYMIPAKDSGPRLNAVYARPILDDGGTIARKALGEKGER